MEQIGSLFPLSYNIFSPQLFHFKMKTLNLTNPILIIPLFLTSLPASAHNKIHHSRLTVCLTDSLDLTRLPVDFVLDPATSFCWRCGNLEFTITILLYKLCKFTGNS